VGGDPTAGGDERGCRVKVVLFCGGQGFRLPRHSETIPKPMAMVGYRPILWHVMRYYAHFGLNDFLLCLGFRGDLVKNYFLRYSEALSNDFVLTGGGHNVELLSSDIHDWHITFADTGLNAKIGERLLAVRRHLGDEEVFCANYADNVTDAPLLDLLEDFRRSGKLAAFLSVRPHYSFHAVSYRPDGLVTGISDVEGGDLWVNGGYFFFRREVFDYIGRGEDLVQEPFRRLIEAGELLTYRYEGFWTALDTLKDLQSLEALNDSGQPPWAPWTSGREGARSGRGSR
jgi:glucose-1-phosphate cytidylyltransferase